MSIESYLERVEGGLEKQVESLWTKMTTYVEEGIEYLRNFLTVLVPAEISALAPFAEEALGEAADALPTLIAGLVAGGFTPGGDAVALTAYASAVTPVLLATAQKAEAAGLTVAGAAVSTALHAAIANAAANQSEPANG
jgi:hypothetical protein